MGAPSGVDLTAWRLQAIVRHPVNGGESLLLFKRQ
jgi:hypothetical protein